MDVLQCIRESKHAEKRFAINGYFGLSFEDAELISTFRLWSNRNPIDVYAELEWITWDYNKIIDEELVYDLEWDVDVFFKHFFTDEEQVKIVASLRNSVKYWQNKRSKDTVRKKATAHTSKRDVREKVFELHGSSCLACGSDEDICIDHVIPVSKGGENSIDNYQPLCKSCNSSKRDKIKDYRNG